MSKDIDYSQREDIFESIEELSDEDINLGYTDEEFKKLLKKGQQIISSQYSLSNYELYNILGQGSFGVVFRARDKSTDQMKAIKIIAKTEEIEKDREYLVYQHLLEAAARKFNTKITSVTNPLCHKNIVCLDRIFSEDNRVVVVMEFVPGFKDPETGTTLDDWLSAFEDKDALPPVREVAKVVYQVSEGVQFLHRLDIMHRDIKLENVLIGENGDIKVADYGLSCFTDILKDCISFAGTPSYMSPQMRDRNFMKSLKTRDEIIGVMKANDVYAIGVVFNYILTGEELPETLQERTYLDKIVSSLVQNTVRFFGYEDNADRLKMLSLMREMTADNWKARPSLSKVMSTLKDIMTV